MRLTHRNWSGIVMKKTRTVHVLSGKGWKLQKDDELPIELEVGKDYYILKMQYHRILKGENPLVVRIEQ